MYEEYLVVFVVSGKKFEKEKFVGGDYIIMVEVYVLGFGRGV